MTGKLYIWHRRLALIVMVPLFLFGLSGLLHPVMRLTAPEVEKRFYVPPVWPDSLPSLKSLPANFPLEKTAGLRPVNLNDSWYLQHWNSREKASQLYDLNGINIPDTAEAYAIQLARHFSGDHSSQINKVRLITEFSQTYAPINRLLPVWEVQLNRPDNLSLFVDIRQDRLATLVDDQRRLSMTMFQYLHVWAFIDQEHPVRTLIFISLMTASLVLGLSGLYLFCVLPLKRRKSKDLKKLHAWSGVIISLSLLMFVTSGLVRTFEKQIPEVRGLTLDQQMDLSDLNVGPLELQANYSEITNIYPHLIDGSVVWQLIQPRKPDIWISAETGEVIPSGGVLFASESISTLQLEQNPESNHRVIFNFKADEHYGFIDKRLPVIALDYPGQSYYVDTRDAVLSVRVNETDKVFSWIFRYLHKWRFADGLGLNIRDTLISVFVLGISLTILLGFKSWVKRRRKQRVATASPNRIEPTVNV